VARPWARYRIIAFGCAARGSETANTADAGRPYSGLKLNYIMRREK
jgi:hypothetical protein